MINRTFKKLGTIHEDLANLTHASARTRTPVLNLRKFDAKKSAKS